MIADTCQPEDTQEHADAAAAVVGPRLEHHLTGKGHGTPRRRLFEVIGDR